MFCMDQVILVGVNEIGMCVTDAHVFCTEQIRRFFDNACVGLG